MTEEPSLDEITAMLVKLARVDEPPGPVVVAVNHPLFAKAADGAVVWRSTGGAVFNPRHPAQGVIWTDKEPA